MLNENILWSEALDPISGRTRKEPTFLGAALLFLAVLTATILVASFFGIR